MKYDDKIKLVICSLIVVTLLFINIQIGSASLGKVNPNECMDIRVLANCTSINLTEVNDGINTYVINAQMTNLGGQTFNYTFCNTSNVGTYSYSWNNPCVDCSQYDCGNSFEVQGSNLFLFIIIFILFYGLAFYGIAIKNEWVSLLGCMGLLITGIYTSFNGIDIYKNNLTTIISYVTLAVGLGVGFEALIEITYK